MEKIELTELVISKFNEREMQVTHNDGELSFNVSGVELPDGRTAVTADFDIGGDDFTHAVLFVIKYPVSEKGGFDVFSQVVSRLNSSITTGKYSLEGSGDNALFCCTYSTTYFNTKFEKMNVERNLMFAFDSLLLEYSDVLKTI